MKLITLVSPFLAAAAATALTISEINGNKFLSPHAGKAVTNVTGLVTAKSSSGFYLRSLQPDNDPRTSESIYVYGSRSAAIVAVGDIVSTNGTVTEYRSSPAYTYLTEITAPFVSVLSRNNSVTSRVIGKDTTSPPTGRFSSLDQGGLFGVPNNVSQLSNANPVLDPVRNGLDFWESLSGELVTITAPTAITKSNNYGDVWAVGPWKVTGRNKKGGLTMTARDENPEAIIIGSPLDGSSNPRNVKLGDSLAPVTGVITQAFGFYALLPLSAIQVVRTDTETAPPTTLTSTGRCMGLTVGAYNVENMAPTSSHIPDVAEHIVNHLKVPDLLFLQEVQDDTGPTDDGTVSANNTLAALASAIGQISDVKYEFADVAPVDGVSGGAPGANIRCAYLYNPSLIRLRKPNPGNGTLANAVLPGPELRYNPGFIDPTNPAFYDSRQPLAAAWETVKGHHTFFTVNVHFSSKGGSSSLAGDARPPVNGALDARMAQANVTGAFISQILSQDRSAAVIAAGDFNEFAWVAPMTHFTSVSHLRDLDEVAGIPEVERYTYMFDMNCQQLDHLYISDKLARRSPKYEHIHVNTWPSRPDQVSDHDPSVARLNVC